MRLKKLAIPVSVLLLTAVVSGCGSKDSSNDKADKTKIENTKEVKKKSETEEVKKEADKSEKMEKVESNQETVSDVNEEDLKNTIIEGKQVLFEIFTSRDPESIDIEKGRASLIEKYDTAAKIIEQMSPYFTERYIDDFLQNILKAEEENGKLTIILGDLGIWAEYPQMKIEKTEKVDDKTITLEYIAPSGVGDINHKATMLNEEGIWKMDKESNN